MAKEILEATKLTPTKPRGKEANHKIDGPFIHSNNIYIQMEDGTMVKKDGDIYNVGQSGVTGPNAEVNNINMNQGSNQNFNEMNIDALYKELETLRMELKKLSQSPEHDQAIGAIASAEIEIKKGDRSKALEYLKQAGTLAFDIAHQDRVNLATLAIKNSLRALMTFAKHMK